MKLPLALALLLWMGASLPAAEGRLLGPVRLAPAAGLEVEHWTAFPLDGAQEPVLALTLVRADPALRRAELLAAPNPETWRTLPQWRKDGGLKAAMNACMFRQDGSPLGYLRVGGREWPALEGRHSGFLCLGPREGTPQAIALVDRNDPGFDLKTLARMYDGIVQGMLILKEGRPEKVIPRLHSASAIALDRQGRLVLAHSPGRVRMDAFVQVLAHPGLGLRSAIYAEGGRESGLVFDQDGPGFRFQRGTATPRGPASKWLPALASSLDEWLAPEGWPVPYVLGIR